jgi:hypothetical protein
VIHVYGFVATPADAPGVDGLCGAPLETVQVGPVTALVSRHDERPEATEEAVIRHARVVEAALSLTGAVLPARFGTGYEDDEALSRAVEPRADALHDRLGSVRGCCEFGVRVLLPENEPTPKPIGGGEYLRQRLRGRDERARLAASLHGPLGEVARESTHRVGDTGTALLQASFLVPDDAREEFERRLGRLAEEHGRLAFIGTGPWPPYSFAEAA